MPVILIGALGGMAAAAPGMFLGATLPALGYQIFMSWVDTNPDVDQRPSSTGPGAEVAVSRGRPAGAAAGGLAATSARRRRPSAR